MVCQAGTKFLNLIYSKRENDVSSNSLELCALTLVAVSNLSQRNFRARYKATSECCATIIQCLTAGALDSCTGGTVATSPFSANGSGLRSSDISST